MITSFQHTRRFLLAALLGLSIPAAQAQYAKDYKRSADQFYAKGDYYSAAQYYEKYLNPSAATGDRFDAYEVKKQGPSATKAEGRSEQEYRLAESYRQLHNYTQALPWYKSVTEKASTAYPLAHYWYAICLRVDGKYGWAQKELEVFLKDYKTSDSYRTQATKELENITFIQQELSHPREDVVVHKMEGNINKEGASYAAGWLDPNTIIFTSTRAAANETKPTHTNALYTATQQGAQFAEASKITLPSISDRQQGVASVTPDGKQLFFTVWSEDKEGQRHAAIYTSTRNGSDWTTPVALGDNINVEGADTRQPQVTPDGSHLLFASNRPGGKGGFDIWYAPLKGGQPGKAVNAGPVINGKGDEQAPFYHATSQTLIFASNGRTGMGGFDLYSSKGSFPAAFSEPQNMGFPVNSVKDDLYFVARGQRLLEDVLFSSDRSSACCLELFSLHKKYMEYVTGQVLDSATQAPLAGVEITGKDGQGRMLPSQTTGADGKYLVVTDAGATLMLAASRSNYQPASLTTNPGAADSITNPVVYLAPIPVKKPDIFEGKKTLVTHNINFQFRQATLTPGSYAYMDDVAVYLKANPAAKLEIAAHTDGIGTSAFNMTLSQKRARTCVDYLVKAGIDPKRLIARGYGESRPLEKETTSEGKDNPTARENNRRVEMTLK